MNQDSLLLDSVPVRLLASLRDLPKRLLFRNEHLQMLLAGLHAGQTLERFTPPTALLLMVAFGQLQVGPGGPRYHEGEELRLEPGRTYDLRAVTETDLLFFIPSRFPADLARHHPGADLPSAIDRQERATLRERSLIALGMV